MSLTSAALLLFCLCAEIARELCFKFAVDRDEAKTEETGFLHMLATTKLLWLGIAIWGVEMVTWILVLESVPLSIAFPVMSLVYGGIPVLSRILFKEEMRPRQWLGAAMITVGVMIVGLTGV